MRRSIRVLLIVLATAFVVSIGGAAETRYFNDALNRLVRVERPDGIVVTYSYDALGNRLTKSVIHDKDFDGAADALDNCLTIYNPAQANSDSDVAGDSCDCAPSDGTAFAVPSEVANVMVSKILGGYRYSWTDQVPTTGSGTEYDVFYGDVHALQAGGDFSTGSCLSDDRPTAYVDDLGPDPLAGMAFYFMVRAQNTCPGGTGTYGNANRDTKAGQSANRCS